MNNLYSQSKSGHRFMINSAKKLKTDYIKSIQDQASEQNYKQVLWSEKLLDVKIKVHENWWNKNSTIKKKDIANREKFVVDTIFQAIQIDDSQIWNTSLQKVDDDQFYTEVTITLYDINTYKD